MESTWQAIFNVAVLFHSSITDNYSQTLMFRLFLDKGQLLSLYVSPKLFRVNVMLPFTGLELEEMHPLLGWGWWTQSTLKTLSKKTLSTVFCLLVTFLNRVWGALRRTFIILRGLVCIGQYVSLEHGILETHSSQKKF